MTSWTAGALSGSITLDNITIIDLSDINIYNIEISNNGNICVCFFFNNGDNKYYAMYNWNFLTSPTTASSWNLVSSNGGSTKIDGSTCWTSSSGFLYVYYIRSSGEINYIPYYQINPNGTLTTSTITTTTSGNLPSYTYNAISVSFDGKYLCAATTTRVFTLYASLNNEYIKSNSTVLIYTGVSTDLYVNCKYISASNYGDNYYQSFIMITSSDLLYYVYNFMTVPVLKQFEYTGTNPDNTFKLLSNVVQAYTGTTPDDNKQTFYTTGDNILYRVRFYINGISETYNMAIADSSISTGNPWSCLKQQDGLNAIMTTSKAIYTYNQGTFYPDDSTGSSFLYCAISGISDTDIPYRLCAVNDTNIIYYSTDGGGSCFIEKTKITVFENNKEIQKNIEYLKKGDLVKTQTGDYKKIVYIGTNKIDVLKNLNHIMVMREGVNEPLFLTPGHSVLFENYDTVNEHYNHSLYDNNIDDYYKIMTQHTTLFEYATLEDITHLNKNNFVNYYHVALENEDKNGQYGIYANGILTESMSINHIRKSGLCEHNKIKNNNLNIMKIENIMV